MGPRSQTERKVYATEMQQAIANYQGLSVKFTRVEDLIMDYQNCPVQGITLSSGEKISKRAIITTGTFLEEKFG